MPLIWAVYSLFFLSVMEAPLPVVVGSVQDPCLGMVVPVILKPSVVSILVKIKKTWV